MSRILLFSAGHGVRTLGAFLELLASARVARVVDVRAIPRSRRHPQFAAEALAEALVEAGLEYRLEGRDLGGFRRPAPESRHSALADDALRGYADHMESAGFRAALERLLAAGREARTAFLCAERFPADCHRSLLADALVARGAAVLHLIDPGRAEPHVLSRMARREGERLVYDAGRGRQLTLGF